MSLAACYIKTTSCPSVHASSYLSFAARAPSQRTDLIQPPATTRTSTLLCLRARLPDRSISLVGCRTAKKNSGEPVRRPGQKQKKNHTKQPELSLSRSTTLVAFFLLGLSKSTGAGGP